MRTTSREDDLTSTMLSEGHNNNNLSPWAALQLAARKRSSNTSATILIPQSQTPSTTVAEIPSSNPSSWHGNNVPPPSWRPPPVSAFDILRNAARKRSRQSRISDQHGNDQNIILQLAEKQSDGFATFNNYSSGGCGNNPHLEEDVPGTHRQANKRTRRDGGAEQRVASLPLISDDSDSDEENDKSPYATLSSPNRSVSDEDNEGLRCAIIQASSDDSDSDEEYASKKEGPWTREEYSTLYQMMQRGDSIPTIAKALSRPISTVRSKWRDGNPNDGRVFTVVEFTAMSKYVSRVNRRIYKFNGYTATMHWTRFSKREALYLCLRGCPPGTDIIDYIDAFLHTSHVTADDLYNKQVPIHALISLHPTNLLAWLGKTNVEMKAANLFSMFYVNHEVGHIRDTKQHWQHTRYQNDFESIARSNLKQAWADKDYDGDEETLNAYNLHDCIMKGPRLVYHDGTTESDRNVWMECWLEMHEDPSTYTNLYVKKISEFEYALCKKET